MVIKLDKSLFLELESFRKEKLKTFHKRLFLESLALIGWVIILFFIKDIIQNHDIAEFILNSYSVGLVIFGFITCLPVIEYKNHYKSKVIPLLLESFGGEHYSPTDSKLDIETLKTFNIMPSYHYSETEDYFCNNFDDVKFEFCELRLKKRGGKTDITVFKGATILLHMPFKFSSHTIVTKDSGKLGNFINSKWNSKEKIKLENLEFEKLFEVLSDDQQAARYLLSPVMMERLLELYKLFNLEANCKSISCEFKNNKVLFLLRYRKNLIEPTSIFKSAYDISKLAIVEKELTIINNIVKQLKLDYLTVRKTAYTKLNQQKQEIK